jgi:hypothetical protein
VRRLRIDSLRVIHPLESIRQLLKARDFGNVQAVTCSNPPQQSMDVVLYRLFRKIQMRCNLFIGKTPRDRAARGVPTVPRELSLVFLQLTESWHRAL